MVKVVVDKGSWAWAPKCRSCHSALEVALSEVKYGTSGMDASDPAYFVDCPVCATQIIVPDKLLTPFFLAQFRRRHPTSRS
jgi:hypothetical protein